MKIWRTDVKDQRYMEERGERLAEVGEEGAGTNIHFFDLGQRIQVERKFFQKLFGGADLLFPRNIPSRFETEFAHPKIFKN